MAKISSQQSHTKGFPGLKMALLAESCLNAALSGAAPSRKETMSYGEKGGRRREVQSGTRARALITPLLFLGRLS